MTPSKVEPGAPRIPWTGLAYVLVEWMTLFALFLDLLTVTNSSDYRAIVILAVVFAAAAVVFAAAAVLVTLSIGRRVSTARRWMLAACTLVNLWTLVDAGGRRLPSLMGW